MTPTVKSENRLVFGTPPQIENRFVKDVAGLKKGNPLAPITAVVRSNLQGIHLLRRIAEETGGVCNLDFLTLTDLAWRLAPDENGEAASTEDLALLARTALLTQPDESYFARFRSFEGAEAAFATTFKELSLSGFAGFPDTTNSVKLKDLTKLYNDYCRLLKESGLREEGDIFRKADPDSFPAGQPLLVYGIYEFFGVHKRFIEALAEFHPISIYLPHNEHLELTRKTRDWLSDAGFALETVRVDNGITTNIVSLADDLFRRDAGPPMNEGKISVIAGRDEYEEVSRAAAEIIRLIAEDGVEPSDVAVIVNGLDQYLPFIADIFGEKNGGEKERIPYYLSPGFPVKLTRAGSALLLLLKLIAAPRRQRNRFDIVELLSFVQSESESGKPSLYNRTTLNAGIIAENDFNDKLTNYTDSLRGEIERALQRGDNYRTRKLESEGTSAEELRKLSDRLFKHLKDFDNPKSSSWKYFCALLRATVNDVFAVPDSYNDILEYIERLGDLDRLGADGAKVDKSLFIHNAVALIESKTEPKGSFGKSGVSVLDMRLARGLRFKAVFLLGLAEGKLPRKYRQDPILLDAERNDLNERSGDTVEIPPRSDDFDIDDALFWSVLYTAGERLYLCCPCAEENATRPKVPSYYLLSAIGKMRGERYSLGDFYDEFGDASKDYREALSPEAFFVRAAGKDAKSVEDILTESNPYFRRRRDLVRARRSKALTEYDGYLDDEESGPALRELLRWGNPVSASVLENYIECPFAFFLSRVLRLEQIAEADKVFELTPMARGNLIHRILFDFYSGLRDSGELPLRASLADEYMKRLDDIYAYRFAEAERGEIVGLPLTWETAKRDIIRTVTAFVRDEAVSDDFKTPAHFELRFGYRGRGDDEDPRSTPDPYRLDLGERELLFSGKVDRVDLGEEGARIIDYKSGKSRAKKKDIAAYNALQLPVYLLAVAHLTGVGLSRTEARYSYIYDGAIRELSGETLRQDLRLFKRKLAELLDLIISGYFGNVTAECGGDYNACDWEEVCYRPADYLIKSKATAPPVQSYLRMLENDFDE
ncbi:MAG: hypothetical protein GY771_05615 [bacterium]|nr:hypothetical protein [bacterium]